MKRAVSLCLLMLMPTSGAFGWGHVGHSAVADIAESRLTPEAARQVKELLAVEHNKHLADIASWADGIKEEHRPESPAHSQRQPLDQSTVLVEDACPSKYCAVKGINTFAKMIGDKSLPIEKREIALKYLVHLVGDLHQPLHAAAATGGNPVVLNGESMNLHHVWDDDIIYAHTRNPEKLAAMLEKNIATSGYEFGGDATSWAFESRDIARDHIYDLVPVKGKIPFVLPKDYTDQKWPLVEQRLTQAGVRLANILNEQLK